MKKIVFSCLFVSLSLFLLTAPCAASPKVEEIVSAKGIKAWLVEEGRLPLVSVAFSFRGGVETDPRDKQGLAVLTASLLTQGAGPYDAAAFQKALAGGAIDLSLTASRDGMNGRLKFLRRDLEEAARLTALALTQPRFDAQDFDRLRAQQETAVRLQTASPNWQARYALYRQMFGDHPYGYRSLGAPQSLAEITRKDLRRFLQDRFAKDSLRVVIVGALSRSEAVRFLDQIFGSLPATAAPDAIPAVAFAPQGRMLLVAREGTQTTVAFAAPMIPRKDPDWYAAEIANYILGGGGFESRLMKAVRANEGLTYGIGTGLAPMEKASMIAGSFDVDNDKAARAISLLEKEWSRLWQDGPTEDEVEAAKAYLKGSWPLSLTSSDAIAAQLLAFQEKGLGRDYWDRYNGLIAAVSQEDVKKVLRRAFAPSAVSFAAVGKAQGLQEDETAQEIKE